MDTIKDQKAFDKSKRRSANRKAKAQGIKGSLFLAECQKSAERKFQKLATLGYTPEARKVRKQMSEVWLKSGREYTSKQTVNQSEINAAKALLKGE